MEKFLASAAFRYIVIAVLVIIMVNWVGKKCDI